MVQEFGAFPLKTPNSLFPKHYVTTQGQCLNCNYNVPKNLLSNCQDKNWFIRYLLGLIWEEIERAIYYEILSLQEYTITLD